MKAEVNSVTEPVELVMVVFENEHYVVEVDGPEMYRVVNIQTGVTEFKDPQYANVISYAEHGQSFIVNELWKWVGVQGAKNKEALDKDSTAVEFESDLDLN